MIFLPQKKRSRKSCGSARIVSGLPRCSPPSQTTCREFLPGAQPRRSRGPWPHAALKSGFRSRAIRSGNAALEYSASALASRRRLARGPSRLHYYARTRCASVRRVIYDKIRRPSTRRSSTSRKPKSTCANCRSGNRQPGPSSSTANRARDRVAASCKSTSPACSFDHDRGKKHSFQQLLPRARIIPYRGSGSTFEFDPKTRGSAYSTGEKKQAP